MSDLTEVELLYHKGRVERWVRFGDNVGDRVVDGRRRVLAFAASSIFAFVRWTSNDYGTAASRIDILRAVAAGEPFSTVPFVVPGAEILLHISGWPKVIQVLAAIDAVERIGIDPADVCPDHWRHVHNRISAGEPPRAYSLARHQAWLLRRRFDA